MPTTPNPQTIRGALNAPDWVAVMNDEINNLRRINVFKEVPRPKNKGIITPRWIFRRKFENRILIKYLDS